MQALKEQYIREGRSDIKFVIVNQKGAERYKRELTRRVTFPVYQDSDQLGIWQKLKGGKDDTFVYDRLVQICIEERVWTGGMSERCVDTFFIW